MRRFRAWNVRRFMKDNQVALLPNGALIFLVEGEESEYESMDYLDVKLSFYTESLDHSGKEACQGDIALHEDHVYCVIVYDIKQAKYKLCPIETYKINAGNGGFTGYELRSEQFEIIGNIYENPELIEEPSN